MKSVFNKLGLAWIILAIATIVSALIFKDTAYENAWFYIFIIGMVLISFAEMFAKR